MVVFVVTFPVAVINSHCQSIHILERGGFFLFLDRDKILDLIEKPLVIVMAEYTIPPTQLRGIAHKVYIISRNLVTGLEVVQHVGHFTNEI